MRSSSQQHHPAAALCLTARVLQAVRQAGMGTNFALEVLKEADELGLRVRACVSINACMCTHACMLCVCVCGNVWDCGCVPGVSGR